MRIIAGTVSEPVITVLATVLDDRAPRHLYIHILVAAMVPAFMHFFGVVIQVHFEASAKWGPEGRSG